MTEPMNGNGRGLGVSTLDPKPDEIDSTRRSAWSGSSETVRQADGSPVPRDDSPPQGAEGQNSEPVSGSEGGGGEDPVAANQELRKKLAETSEAVANLRAVAEALNEHPDLREELLRRERGEAKEEDEFSELDQMVDDSFNEKSAAALKKLLRKAAELGERRTDSKLKPVYGQVRRSAASVEAAKALRQEGLDASLLDDAEFQSHLNDLRGRHRTFTRLELDDPSTAYALAAARWKEKHGRRMDFDRERRRVEDVKNSTLHRGGGTPSRAAQSEKIEVRRGAGMRGILDALKRGVDPGRIDRK